MTRKLLKLTAFLLILITALASSCQPEEPKEIEYTILPESLNFEATGGEDGFIVTIKSPATVESVESFAAWCQVSTNGASPVNVMVTVDPYTYYEARTTTVVVNMKLGENKTSATVPISQEGVWISIDDLISSNLLKNGYIDPTFLVGKWQCIKFAYTADGNVILDVTDISLGHLTIPIAPTPIENNLDNRWCLSHTNKIWYVCSLSNNLINLTLKGSTYINPPPEEIDINFALENAYSFIIRDDELIIYFRGDENKNLFILRKDRS